MATYSKIPQKVREKGCVACGPYAVFCGLLAAGKVFSQLNAQDNGQGIPAHGYIVIKGIKYYYCRYGLVSDPDIYSGVTPKKGK